MVDRIGGSYYALPLIESEPQGLQALLPPETEDEGDSMTAAAIQVRTFELVVQQRYLVRGSLQSYP